jgi:hypothetical protein
VKTPSAILGSACALLALAAAPSGAQAVREAPLQLAPRPTAGAITPADAQTRLYILADDSMMGREAGTRGNVMGTDYIAREAQRMGLLPAGENGTYFQTIPLVNKALDPAATLSADGQALTLFTDFLPLPHVNGFLEVGESLTLNGAPVVFGGRWGSEGAMTPEQARGKFVVFAAGERQPAWQIWTAGPMSRYSGAAGLAIATLDISPPGLVQFVRNPQEGMHQEQAGNNPPVLVVTRAAAERLMGASLEGLAVGAAGKAATGSFRFAETPSAFPARNVVAILPGSDPVLRSQYVAIGAHNDHVGMGEAVDHDSIRVAHRLFRAMGADMPAPRLNAEQSARVRAGRDSLARLHPARRDSIFNGADDDGSGTTGVLEIAEYFASRTSKPRRSLLFVWHTAEEKGLYGSEFFTDHPTVPRDSIVAQLNIDMIGRGMADDQAGTAKPAAEGAEGAAIWGGPGYLQLVGSRRLSTQLGDLVEEVNRNGHNLHLDYALDVDGHPSNIYCRSDHYSYARYGIPVTFFTTGLHADYHQVTDEAEYIDFDRLASVSRFVADIAAAVANRADRLVVDHPKPDPHGQCQQ